MHVPGISVPRLGGVVAGRRQNNYCFILALKRRGDQTLVASARVLNLARGVGPKKETVGKAIKETVYEEMYCEAETGRTKASLETGPPFSSLYAKRP